MNAVLNFEAIDGRNEKFGVIERRNQQNKKLIKERKKKVQKILKRINYLANGFIVLSLIELVGAIDTFTYTNGLNGIKTFVIGLIIAAIVAWIGLSVKVICHYLSDR